MRLTTKIYRSGTRQIDRMGEALDPAYISVEERSLEDLLTFVKGYAEKLRFYNETNVPDGDWSGFLDATVQDFMAFIKNPNNFAHDQKTLRKFSQPHLVLFFAFLQLLRYPQAQFRELTQKHLDFYYKQVLKLREKPEVPDKVHVIFELAQNLNTHLIKKGTLLRAGLEKFPVLDGSEAGSPKNQRVELFYATDEELVVNKAQIASVKTLYVEKTRRDLKSIHQQYDRNDKGFEKMLRWALGCPKREAPLPLYPDGCKGGIPVDIGYLKTLYQQFKRQKIEDIDQEQQTYILRQLCFTKIEDFKYCMAIHIREMGTRCREIDMDPPTEEEWEHVYALIERCYKKRINLERRQALREEYLRAKRRDEQTAFERMLRFALGEPNPGDPLPAMPQHDTTNGILTGGEDLERLAEKLNDPSTIRYIREEFFMDIEDFRRVMTIKKNFPDDSPEWEEIYRLVARAQTQKRNLIYPPINQNIIHHFLAGSVFQEQKEKDTGMAQFSTFGGEPTPNPLLRVGFFNGWPFTPPWSPSRGELSVRGVRADRDAPRNPNSPLEGGRGVLRRHAQPKNLPLKTPGSSPEESGGTMRCFRYYKPGLAIASPILRRLNVSEDLFPEVRGKRAEGIRKCLTLTIVSQENTLNKKIIAEILEESDAPFDVSLSSGSQWIIPETTVCNVGDFLLGKPQKIYEEEILSLARFDGRITGVQSKSPPGESSENIVRETFTQNDVGKLLVWNDGKVLKITERIDEHKVNITVIGQTTPDETIKQYHPSAFYANSLQLIITLDKSAPDILPPKPVLSRVEGIDDPAMALGTALPVVKVELNDLAHYETFRTICFQKIRIDAGVKSIQGELHIARTSFISQLSALSSFWSDESFHEIPVSALQGEESEGDIFHIFPFGYVNIRRFCFRRNTPGDSLRSTTGVGSFPSWEGAGVGSYLLPQYDKEGYLFIGIRDLHPPQSLSVLFQLAAGTSDPDLEAPDIRWSYLSRNGWRDFTPFENLSDRTDGLTSSGIIRFTIPEYADDRNTVMPGGLYWLRAVVDHNSCAIPDILDMRTQAVRATFRESDTRTGCPRSQDASSHLRRPLASNMITKFVKRDPAVKTVKQPYPSFQGKKQEDSRAFYTRVSERLRHKQRSLTPWDYERLALERFPEIYSVKCLCQSEQRKNPVSTPRLRSGQGEVTVVVVPVMSASATLNMNSVKPKVPLTLRKEIEEYLQTHTSSFIRIHVKNPRYEQIKYHILVRFREGYNREFYLKQLNEDIKRFLSPWVEEGVPNSTAIKNMARVMEPDIPSEREIPVSMLIRYIEHRPYVDRLASLKLIEHIDETGRNYPLDDTHLARVRHPEAILISASQHDIAVMTGDYYEYEHFEGIDSMTIARDFEVRPPALKFQHCIGNMVIGEDFEVH